MKQTTKKKPRVFRTLIRLIHIGEDPAHQDNNGQTAGMKDKRQEARPPFFFGQ